MAEFITGATGEVLTYYEGEDTPLIKDIVSTISSGTYIKVSNQQFLFQNMSRVVKVETLPFPNYFGYVNNNSIIDFEVSYNEE